jgi:hypothetical protein
MKTTRLTLLPLASLMLGISVYITRADLAEEVQYFNNSGSFVPTSTAGANYNPPPQTIRPDYTNSFNRIAGSNCLWSANNNTLLNPNSGSAEFDFIGVSSTTNPADISSAVWTMDIRAAGLSNCTAVSFDIMVNTNSAQDASGGYGTFITVMRDNSYSYPTNNSGFTNYSEELGNPTFATNGNLAGTWEHVVITGANGLLDAAHPSSGATNNVRAITWGWYWSGHNLNGNVTCYIDNLAIYTNGVVTKPTMSISKYTGPRGVLNAQVTPNGTSDPINADGTYYQRQGIRSVARTYGWIGGGDTYAPGGGGHGPTNVYSITITNAPPPAYSNLNTYLWISSGTPTEPNADWVETNVVALTIVNNADGTATGTLRWKIYDPGDNGYFYGHSGFSTGFLASATSPSPLGTWAIQFDHSTNVTLISPGNAPVSTNVPYIDTDGVLMSQGYDGATLWGALGVPLGSAIFTGPCTVFVGCQPVTTNTIGQTVGFSSVQISSNGVVLVNETFQNGLNSSTWVSAAEDPFGISTIPGYANYLVSWTLPDFGFALGTNANLSAVSGWGGPGYPPFSNNGKRSAYAADTGKSFYRLQYILPH